MQIFLLIGALFLNCNMVKTTLRSIILFIGWILSPFTWWNDAFVNIPISYIGANIAYYITGISFRSLVIGFYWLTNLIGILLMYLGGRGIIVSSRYKFRSVIIIIISVTVYSAAMVYLDKHGKLLPIKAYFERYCTQHKTGQL